MRTPIRDPRDVLRSLFAIRDRLGMAPSVQGVIEDQLRQGGRVQCTVDLDRAQHKFHTLAEAAWMTLGLTDEEETICRDRYVPDARMDGVATYERIVRDGDVPTACAGQGEEVLPGTARDPSGKRMPGFACVRGTRARMPSFLEIARRRGLTSRQVKSRIESALAKVRDRINTAALEFERLDRMDV